MLLTNEEPYLTTMNLEYVLPVSPPIFRIDL